MAQVDHHDHADHLPVCSCVGIEESGPLMGDGIKYDMLAFILLVVAGEAWSIARVLRWHWRGIKPNRSKLWLTVALFTVCLSSCSALTLQESMRRTEYCRATHRPAYYDGDMPHWNEPECHS